MNHTKTEKVAYNYKQTGLCPNVILSVINRCKWNHDDVIYLYSSSPLYEGEIIFIIEILDNKVKQNQVHEDFNKGDYKYAKYKWIKI
jgi:hypothetical protein